MLVVAQLFPQSFDAFFDAVHRVWSYNYGIAPFRQPVLIYNPAAGKIRRDPQALLQRTTAALSRVNLEPRLLPTSTAGHADALAREAIQAGADLVLTLGGDGTIHEVVQGLAHSNVPLGILPGGTANVLAMELGLGSRLERAAERLATFEPRSVALGRITGEKSGSRYFLLLMCGAGLDATIVYEVHAGLKAASGKLAYWAAGLAMAVKTVPPVDVRLNGVTRRCGFALVSRVRNYGGDLEICRGAGLTCDDFEVVLFEGSNPLRYAWYMLGVAARRVQKMRGVHTERARCLEVLSATPAQVDGEFVGREPLQIEIVPHALNLLLPPNYG
jgi:diacylglycerol kinase (ATP)